MPDRASGKERRALSRYWRLFRHHWLIASIAVILVLFVAATAVLFIWPSTDQPRRVDGVVALAGDGEPGRQSEAISLAEEGYAPVVLISQGGTFLYEEKTVPDFGCPDAHKVHVVCFIPNPPQTIGEIEWASRYANRHHWHALILVSGRAQVSEARVLMGRCYSGEILMVAAPSDWKENLEQIPHEWGGLAKALITDEHC